MISLEGNYPFIQFCPRTEKVEHGILVKLITEGVAPSQALRLNPEVHEWLAELNGDYTLTFVTSNGVREYYLICNDIPGFDILFKLRFGGNG